MPIDAADASNAFMEFSEPTFHHCARCVTAYASGSLKYFGKVGCQMVPLEGDRKKIFKDWVASGSAKCLRCWNSGSDCAVVPVELRDDFPRIEELLAEIRNGYSVDMVESSTVPGEMVERRTPLSDDRHEADVSRLMTLCRPLAKSLATTFVPHSKYLVNHNGSIEEDDAPEASFRPVGRKRDNKTIAAKHEAGKRKVEAEVVDQLAGDADEPSTPHKKAKTGAKIDTAARDLERKKSDLEAQLRLLEGERESASSAAKRSLTKRINALKKELDKL